MLPRPTAEPMAAKMNADRETKTSLWGDDLIDMMSFPDRPRSLATELRPCRIDREAARSDVRTEMRQRPSLRSSLLSVCVHFVVHRLFCSRCITLCALQLHLEVTSTGIPAPSVRPSAVTSSLYDTASRATEELRPGHAGQVGIYFCGATVQGQPH